jgi:hypothetical protein
MNNIGINFPFVDSAKGYYLDMTVTDADEIRANLMHLLLTNKGERFMMPNFGTDLIKYLFEPMINKTFSDLKLEINDTVKKFIPNLQVDDIIIDETNLDEHMVIVTIKYTTTDGTYNQSSELTIPIKN